MNLPRVSRSSVVLPLVALALGLSCQAGAADAPKPAAAATAPAKVLATVNGSPVSQQEVEAKVLEQVLQRQPNLIEAALSQVIDEKVLDLEAAKQKITRDQLLDKEVKAKITAVSDADIDKFYEDKKSQIRAPKEQIAGQIKAYLESQRQQEVYGKYLESLRGQYAVKNMLAEQREAEEAVKATERRGMIESGDAPSVGPANASVTLVEFSDFQCPFCGRIVPAIDGVRKNYGDKVKLIFRQFPLNSIHPFAQKAAEAALCAREQGKFWEMHDLLFKEQDKLEVADLKDKASRVGLKADAFAACLDGSKMADKVAAEVALGTKIGVSGTPSLFLNGRQVPGGAIPYEELAKQIDTELAKAKK